MTPYYEHAGITIYHGDCREILPTLPKCDLLLTDPPYRGPRMTRFVAIWSLKRGNIDPPEPLDDAEQRAANLEAYNAQAAYRAVRYERDPPLTEEQRWLEELGRRTAPNQTRAECA